MKVVHSRLADPKYRSTRTPPEAANPGRASFATMLGEGDVIAFEIEGDHLVVQQGDVLDEWVNAINGALDPARLPSITSTTST